MDNAIWAVVGLLLGSLITGYFANRRERIRADREAALDGAKRQDDRRLGRDSFQRESLLALQDAMNTLEVVAFGLSQRDLPTEMLRSTALRTQPAATM